MQNGAVVENGVVVSRKPKIYYSFWEVFFPLIIFKLGSTDFFLRSDAFWALAGFGKFILDFGSSVKIHIEDVM